MLKANNNLQMDEECQTANYNYEGTSSLSSSPNIPLLSKFKLVKSSSGTTINGIKVKHIPEAQELINEVENGRRSIFH